MNTTNNLIVGVAAVLLISILWVGYAVSNNEVVIPEIPPVDVNIDVEALSAAVAARIVIPDPVQPTTQVSSDGTVIEVQGADSESVNRILDLVSEEERAEDMALELAEDEFGDRDFKRVIRDLINFQLEESGINSEVESYRDIEKVVIVEDNIHVSGDDAEVELEVKVYFYLDDEDSEDDELYRARFDVEFEVEDLDEDEDFLDAELVDYDEENFEFVRFYGDLRLLTN